MMKTDRIIKWLWLKLDVAATSRKGTLLYDEFGSIEAIYDAGAADYEKLKFLSKDDVSRLCCKECTKAHSCFQTMKNENISILTPDMEEYPELLCGINRQPYLLFVKGRILNLNNYLCIGVVGTRNPTIYGQKMTYSLSRGIALNGAVIISGMALGVDAVAHMAALESQMPTVAVLGSGVDVVSPKSNEDLYERIAEKGMILSEYPLSSPATNYTFPERNRIIAGLCHGLLVTEADVKSGSLITADCSLKFGRDVFSVPGNIDSETSQGTNSLIKQGAYAVTTPSDVTGNFYSTHFDLIKNTVMDFAISADDEDTDDEDNSHGNMTMDENASDDEKIMFSLSDKPLTVDQISYQTGISLSDLNVSLLMLEMAGKIKKTQGIYYTLA